MVSHTELIERIRRAYAVAVPSVSDVAPNVVIDAIRCGKPFLLTKYSGYADRFGEYGILVDPLSIEDMTRGIKELADPAVYSRLCKRIAEFKEVRTYADIAREYVALMSRHVH
jgi:glycosyltransferase involved in cell wall biosynthesis